MRGTLLILASISAFAVSAGAQQAASPAQQDGPMHAPQSAPASPQPEPTVPRPLPQPLSDGSYSEGVGVTSPRATEAVAAIYPANAAPGSIAGNCLVSLIVDADGVPVRLHILRSHGDDFDAAAVDAIEKSKFEPGTLEGKPVAVHATIRVHFSEDGSPAIPAVLTRHFGAANVDQAPRPIHTVEAEFSEEARRKGVEGVVRVSFTVNEDGLPVDAKVVKSVGSGLDEKALEAVSQYRFTPAMKDGKPVAMKMEIEVSFNFYGRSHH